RTGRTAYAFDTSKLPEAIRGLDWRQVNGFSAADEVLQDPGLKQVFEAKLKHGYALVTPA
ncbi:hypothetical protein, partial [Bradyrhizobium sp. 44]|uniref:hypothetical protein n=1 Tax=Bradyrhizobium sp. 44 TaxID=2782675 RepID=UPI001FFA5D71